MKALIIPNTFFTNPNLCPQGSPLKGQTASVRLLFGPSQALPSALVWFQAVRENLSRPQEKDAPDNKTLSGYVQRQRRELLPQE